MLVPAGAPVGTGQHFFTNIGARRRHAGGMSKLGKRSTAEEALQGQSLKGRTAIVTGASSGLGVETTRVLR